MPNENGVNTGVAWTIFHIIFFDGHIRIIASQVDTKVYISLGMAWKLDDFPCEESNMHIQ